MTYPIIDSHCHLDFDVLKQDLPGVIARAENAGVHLMVSICTRVHQFDQVLAIAEAHENIFCSVGTHPHNASKERDIDSARLVSLSTHPKVIGIGEAGLDFYYDRSPRGQQEQVFRTHIDAARKTGLPLIIHSRDAEEDTLRILRDEMKKGAFRPLLHCFSSKPYLAEKALELDAYVSFSGILTFNSAEQIRDAARLVPMNRLLVETDAPFLAPVPVRGKTNEPAYTAHTLAKLAEIKQVSIEEMARATTSNFFKLFDKTPKPSVFESPA